MTTPAACPAVAHTPLVLLRVEGAALFAGATICFAQTGLTWWLYAALILAPDISFAGYLLGARTGALVYNAAHTTTLPIALALIGFGSGMPIVAGCGLIWLAHIGIDRAMGYGLKYPEGFGFTHLGGIGRAAG